MYTCGAVKAKEKKGGLVFLSWCEVMSMFKQKIRNPQYSIGKTASTYTSESEGSQQTSHASATELVTKHHTHCKAQLHDVCMSCIALFMHVINYLLHSKWQSNFVRNKKLLLNLCLPCALLLTLKANIFQCDLSLRSATSMPGNEAGKLNCTHNTGNSLF